MRNGAGGVAAKRHVHAPLTNVEKLRSKTGGPSGSARPGLTAGWPAVRGPARLDSWTAAVLLLEFCPRRRFFRITAHDRVNTRNTKRAQALVQPGTERNTKSAGPPRLRGDSPEKDFCVLRIAGLRDVVTPDQARQLAARLRGVADVLAAEANNGPPIQ
jgi:hypothetical protein